MASMDEFGAMPQADAFSLKLLEHRGERLLELACAGNGETTGADVIVVLDVSGSMGTESTVQDATGSVAKHGFSILDICKHATRALAATLDASSRLGLIVFDSNTREVLPLEPATGDHVQTLHKVLEGLGPGSCTNLWGGLELALDTLTKDASARPKTIVLLTDGAPNESPPLGEVAALAAKRKKSADVANVTVHTAGFGYSLNHGLLGALADEAGGLFAFVPDAGMVGTTFNHLASALSTAGALDVKVSFGDGSAARVGPLRRGEVRRVLAPAGSPGPYAASGTTKDGKTGALTAANDLRPRTASAFESRWVAVEKFRGAFADVLAGSTGDDREGTADALAALAAACRATLASSAFAMQGALLKADAAGRAAAADPKLSEARAEMARAEAWRDAWAAALRDAPSRWAQRTALGLALPAGSDALRGVHDFGDICGPDVDEAAARLGGYLQDLEGQCRVACESQQFWVKWGRYYLRSLRSAHAQATAHNFKDESVQGYFGAPALAALAKADAAFAKLPPPKPSRSGTGVASGAAMASAYYNRCNGCVSADSPVLRVSAGIAPEVVRADEVRAGDWLVNADTGAPARVQTVVRTACSNGAAKLVQVGDVRLTAWHPVKPPGSTSWAFPADVGAPKSGRCFHVYSFLFEDRAAAYLTPGGCAVIALAHGVRDDPVAAHPFFGSEMVVAALEACEGFDTGRVDLLDGAFLKVGGYVCGIDAARVAPREVAAPALAPLVACA